MIFTLFTTDLAFKHSVGYFLSACNQFRFLNKKCC